MCAIHTLPTVGFINYPVEKLNIIKRILNDRLAHKEPLFEEEDQEALKWANEYWQQLSKRKIDVSAESYEKKKRSIDTDTMRHKDVREIGLEWMCCQAVAQLGIKEYLENKGWDEARVQLALTQITSRAVYSFPKTEQVVGLKKTKLSVKLQVMKLIMCPKINFMIVLWIYIAQRIA